MAKATTKKNDKKQLKGIIKQFPVEVLISVLLESELLPALLAAADPHIETVKQGSAIRKVVFKGKGKWGPRRFITGGGWTRTRTNTTNPGSECVVTYLDGSTQTHLLGSGEKVEYKDGQYFFPNAGTDSA